MKLYVSFQLIQDSAQHTQLALTPYQRTLVNTPDLQPIQFTETHGGILPAALSSRLVAHVYLCLWYGLLSLGDWYLPFAVGYVLLTIRRLRGFAHSDASGYHLILSPQYRLVQSPCLF